MGFDGKDIYQLVTSVRVDLQVALKFFDGQFIPPPHVGENPQIIP